MPTVTDEERDEIVAILAAGAVDALDAYNVRQNSTPDARPANVAPEALRETIHDTIVPILQKRFPDDGIRTYRLFERKEKSKRVWVLVELDGAPRYEEGSVCFTISIGCYNIKNNKPLLAVIEYPVIDSRVFSGKARISAGKGPALRVDDLWLPGMGTTDAERPVVAISPQRAIGSEIAAFIAATPALPSCEVRISGCATDDAIKLVEGRLDGVYYIKLPALTALIICALVEGAGGQHNIDWPNLASWDEELTFMCSKPGAL